jgi:hypothetical protein
LRKCSLAVSPFTKGIKGEEVPIFPLSLYGEGNKKRRGRSFVIFFGYLNLFRISGLGFRVFRPAQLVLFQPAGVTVPHPAVPRIFTR